MFSELISRTFTFQWQENILRELISRKLHIKDSFVIQRITWTSVLGILFLENFISVTWNNVFGINFARLSDWSVRTLGFSRFRMNYVRLQTQRVSAVAGATSGSFGARWLYRLLDRLFRRLQFQEAHTIWQKLMHTVFGCGKFFKTRGF